MEIIFGILFLAFGIFFGWYTIPLLRKRYELFTKGISTTGVITGHESNSRAYGQSYSYADEIEFQTRQGEQIFFVSSFYFQYSWSRAAGTRVKVLYNPENPQDAIDASFMYFWLIPLCFLAASLGGIYLSLCLFLGITPI